MAAARSLIGDTGIFGNYTCASFSVSSSIDVAKMERYDRRPVKAACFIYAICPYLGTV